MDNCVLKIEELRVKHGFAFFNVTIISDETLKAPRLSAVFYCGDQDRIIPLKITSKSDKKFSASGEIELAYIFCNKTQQKKAEVKFLFSGGTGNYAILSSDEKLTLPITKKKVISHFVRANRKEKKRIILAEVFSLFSIPCRFRKVRSNKVTFLSNRANHLSGNIKDVFYEMTKIPDLDITVLCREGNIAKNLPIIFRFLKLYYTSRIVFVDDYYPLISYARKNKNTKLIQLWHACGAFKTFGYSRLGNDNQLDQGSPNHRQYDHVIVSSKEVIPNYAEGFGVSMEKIIALGSPRCDKFANEGYRAEFSEKFYRENPDLKDKKIILFAPSFRGGGQGNCYYPSEQFEADKLLKAIDENYVIAVKMHPYLSEQISCSKKHESRLLNLSEQYDVNDLLLVTDILITDYSSVIFEASVLNIPMLFFAFDLEEYSRTRDFYSDFSSFVPGRIVFNTSDMIAAINKEDFCQELVEPFAERHFDQTIGNSTGNVVDFVKTILEEK